MVLILERIKKIFEGEEKDMKKLKIIILTIFSALILTTNAIASITLSELSVELNITGGDCVTRNITIENTDSNPATISFETIITPDGDGIDISYSMDSPFIMQGKTKIILIMFVNTSFLLMPGVYEITTKFYTESPAVIGRTVHYNWVKPVIPTENETNETAPPIIPPSDNNTNNTTPLFPPTTDDEFNWLWLLIPIGIIALVTLLALLYKRRKKTLGYEYPAHEKGKLKKR